MATIKMTFDKSAKTDMLDILGKTIDSEGYIIEKETPSQRVLAEDGQEIKADDFGLYKKGSEIFISNNVVSLLKYVKSEKK